eukprot:SAG11_NODE_756_length_7324_cov_13.486505_8_plen_95_part_00
MYFDHYLQLEVCPYVTVRERDQLDRSYGNVRYHAMACIWYGRTCTAAEHHPRAASAGYRILNLVLIYYTWVPRYNTANTRSKFSINADSTTVLS